VQKAGSKLSEMDGLWEGHNVQDGNNPKAGVTTQL
jgi:hypothetical protein